jgi:N-acetylglucosaminyl-diphospho-decaprenol L-rhamnosyltransferase
MVAVSVIIVNWNTEALLRECLDSVYADLPSFALEVIVIDNGSEDGSVGMVRTHFPQVQIILNQSNEGFARPNNVGMNASTGNYIFLLNSDTVVRSGAIAGLKFFLDKHPQVGACGPMLLNPDGTVQRSVKGVPSLWTHACDMLFLDRLFPHTHFFGGGEMAYFSYEQTQEVDHLMAAALLVRRDVVRQIGMFDERFSIYYNDMDLCCRIKHAGWKLMYVHTAQIVHHHGKTIARLNKDFGYHREMRNNIMLFYQKHYGRWSVVVYKLLLFIGFMLRSTGWGVARLVRPTERTVLMSRFSWKTLAMSMEFWTPVPERR